MSNLSGRPELPVLGEGAIGDFQVDSRDLFQGSDFFQREITGSVHFTSIGFGVSAHGTQQQNDIYPYSPFGSNK